jgi:dihydrofolate reductase
MHRQRDTTSHPGIPKVAIIVAMTKDRVIGSGKDLPWHLPEDLQLFKSLTMGGTIIMGRKTHAAIGRPLPGRHNIVLSRSQEELPGVEFCKSFVAGLTSAAQFGRPVFVIGGAELYQRALPIASELHISWVNGTVSGDVYFPEFDLADWSIYEEKGHQGFHYRHYKRKESK